MKYIITMLACMLVACQATKSIDERLAEVWKNDQAIRVKMLDLTRAVTVEGRMELVDSLFAAVAEEERVDAENMEIVEELLREGLPKGLSDKSYQTIWIVIDHTSLQKQEQYLPLVQQMADAEMIGRDEYATLFDRVAMKQNRPQRYGSQSIQFGAPEAIQLWLWPVECPQKLDSLRRTVGMLPISDYLNTLTQTMGVECHFDPSKTIDDLNRMRATE